MLQARVAQQKATLRLRMPLFSLSVLYCGLSSNRFTIFLMKRFFSFLQSL